MIAPRAIAGRVLLAASAAILGCSCSTPTQKASAPEPHARQFEAEIARIQRDDPTSPAVLSARLTYVEFLLRDSSGPCGPRLERARAELDRVSSSPEARAMFPDGWARTADLEYRLRFARASCGPAKARDFELWTALESGRRAVELYRQAFDYHSMVIMQFDVAVVLRQLGEKAAAITVLQSAIDMDREYGFRDDAEQNYGVLLSWRGEPSSPGRLAALMRDFPQRAATFTFAWPAGDAAVAVRNRRVRLESGKLTESRAAAKLEEHLSAAGGSWSVSYLIDPGTRYDPGVWPVNQSSRMTEDIFPPALLASSSFKVSGKGDFESVSDSAALASQVASDASLFIRAHAPSGRSARKLTQQALETTTASLSSELLEAAAQRNYSLETGMWIGAKLDQSVWYRISAPLPLPGIPRVIMQQSIEFAFTRTVPCTARAEKRACVELVLHVTPDENALGQWLDDMRADGTLLHFASSLDIRLITDPQTLLSYGREEHAYWYASVGTGKADQLIESEHTTSTTGWLADAH